MKDASFKAFLPGNIGAALHKQSINPLKKVSLNKAGFPTIFRPAPQLDLFFQSYNYFIFSLLLFIEIKRED